MRGVIEGGRGVGSVEVLESAGEERWLNDWKMEELR
jgi:hypothetical protein